MILLIFLFQFGHKKAFTNETIIFLLVKNAKPTVFKNSFLLLCILFRLHVIFIKLKAIVQVRMPPHQKIL